MATRDSAGLSPAARKIRLLGIIVAITVVLYSAGWFYVASKFETFLGGILNHPGQGVVDIRCDKFSTGGFPFLIGFTCDKTALEDVPAGNALAAGAMRAAARIYNPGAAVVELEGPAEVSFGDGSAVDAQWQTLRASLRAGLSGLSTFSAEAAAPSVRLSSPMLDNTFFAKSKDGQFHVRQNNGDLEVAVLAHDFTLTEGAATTLLSPLSSSIELTLIGKGELLQGAPLASKAMAGQLTSFKIDTPEGIYGEMSGPFTIDEDGLISGTFMTTLEKLDLWENNLRRLFPKAGDTISGVAILLKGLAKGKDRVTVKLEVRKGAIFLSLLPLGHIPPI
ncbi:DUF2125 domain-containing protein [Rhizobium sp. KVB221]|uniref:DUF2125 domain-containing protein n=1 Tax=Rhizobium setariae TaxID=2801340 RepID=A0A937CQM9_9HYPH|nr:DUF2125 domain-containing protein [Rhizobium setariae]MBL0374709.1 DUF2125 domain-containing protein [Rhizobium setariae]